MQKPDLMETKAHVTPEDVFSADNLGRISQESKPKRLDNYKIVLDYIIFKSDKSITRVTRIDRVNKYIHLNEDKLAEELAEKFAKRPAGESPTGEDIGKFKRLLIELREFLRVGYDEAKGLEQIYAQRYNKLHDRQTRGE